MTASRERWVCPTCGHTEELLPYTSYYEHRYQQGIIDKMHKMKKEKTK